jgi:hypothetical protein
MASDAISKERDWISLPVALHPSHSPLPDLPVAALSPSPAVGPDSLHLPGPAQMSVLLDALARLHMCPLCISCII